MKKEKISESKSKKISRLIIALATIILVSFGFTSCCDIKEMFGIKCDTSKKTTLKITNNSEYDSVLTYLTLGADTNFITNVNGIFGIKQSGLQGNFWLLKDSTYAYEYDGKGISGNISFNTPPINCPTPMLPNGNNLYEFTINNAGTVPNAQETVDISNVAGCNAIGSILFIGGDKWTANDTNRVDSISNSYIYNNYGRIGVYPFGCDICTASQNPPQCQDTLKVAKPQSEPICNIQRNAEESGGIVHIVFESWALHIAE